ncbi:MAG: hypothetical protein FWB96_12795 [Defluviitaleaceae bacterium]|nr:hypothetical protein [Defluviitaleaceae bacterium]MCL2264036.1 hypothetical protein [Defluviitaleaceae bacterium]
MVKQHMEKKEMYELYPRKWLVINEPVCDESNGEILSGELLGVYEKREHAFYELGKIQPRLRSIALINSIAEE